MTFKPAESFTQNAAFAVERKRQLGEATSNFQYENGSPRQLADGVRKAGTRLADYVKQAIDDGRSFGAVAGSKEDKTGYKYGGEFLSTINNGPFGYLAEDTGSKKDTKNAMDGEFGA